MKKLQTVQNNVYTFGLTLISNLSHFHFDSEHVNCMHYNPKKAQPISCYLHKTFNIVGASVNLICCFNNNHGITAEVFGIADQVVPTLRPLAELRGGG